MKNLPFSTSSLRNIHPIIIAALLAASLLTSLSWLGVTAEWQSVVFWASIALVMGLSLLLKRKFPATSKAILVLAIFAGTSLIYLFPELFSPGCNGMPKAFAANNCVTTCTSVCSNWKPAPCALCSAADQAAGKCEGCCFSYNTTCVEECDDTGGGNTAPTIAGLLTCSVAGNGSWCRSGLNLDLTATDAQSKVLVSGDLNGAPFACNNGQPSSSPAQCSISLPEGTGTANFTATDTSGATKSGSKLWYLDSINPVANGSLSGTLGSNNWYVSPVNFSGSGTDSGSGLAGVTCTLDGNSSACSGSVSANGPHTLVVTATDNAGNSNTVSRTFSIDTQAPTLNSSLSGTIGNNGWYTSATLNASTSDASPSSGTPTLEFALDAGAWVSFAGSYSIPDGQHTQDVRAVDPAGNITQATQITVKVDSVLPAIALNVNGTAGNNGWYTSSAQVNASASDATSGLSALEYSLDNGNTWAAYSTPLTLSDGIHAISFYAEDAAGNARQMSQTVQVDQQAPQISGSLAGTLGTNGWYVSDVTVSASAIDPSPASGISSFKYRFNGGAQSDYVGTINVTDGVQTVVFEAEDMAGLTDNFSQNIKVDTLAPTLSISSVLPEWIEDSVTLTGTAADGTSGLFKVEVSTDNGASWNLASGTTNWSYVWNTQAGNNGAQTVRLRSLDNAGLTTNTAFIAQVDNIAPQIELPSEWQFWETVIFNAWDNHSGLADAEIVISDPHNRWPKRRLTFQAGHLPLDFKWDRRFGDGTVAPLGDYDVDVWATDRLGNVRHVTATIHINLAGSIFPAPATATPLASPQPSATATQMLAPASLTPNPTGAAGLSMWGTPGSAAQATATATSMPFLREPPAQQNIFTILQSFFSPPTDGSPTQEDFESSSGPSLFAAARTDPNQMAGDIATGAAAITAIAAFAAYIEQKKREEAQAAAKRSYNRATSSLSQVIKLRRMTPDELAAENLRLAIAAVTAKEQKEWQDYNKDKIAKETGYQELKGVSQQKYVKQRLEEIWQKEQQDIQAEFVRERNEAIQEAVEVGLSTEQINQLLYTWNMDGSAAGQALVNTAVEQQVVINAFQAYKSDERNADQIVKEYQERLAFQEYREQERKPLLTTVASNVPVEQETWQDKLWNDAYRDQALLSIGIGITVGVLAVIGVVATIITAPAWVVIGGAVLVTAVLVGAGTLALNAHFGLDLGENLVNNLLYGTVAAFVTSGLGIWLYSLAPAAGTFIADTCQKYPAACRNVGTVIDNGEEALLVGQIGYYNWIGDQDNAEQALIELQLEQMDGGAPGNSIANELGEQLSKLGPEAVEQVSKHGPEIIPLLLKYGDEGVGIIRTNGDEGIALLVKYGDDAADAVRFLNAGEEVIDDILKNFGDDAVTYSDGLIGSLDDTVLGRLPDTKAAQELGLDMLDDPNWSEIRNFEWLQEKIDDGEIFYIGSQINEANLLSSDPDFGEINIFAKELDMLLQNGYIRVGDYLAPGP